MEGTAEEVFNVVNTMLENDTGGRVWVAKLEVKENEKNSAIVEMVKK